MKPIIRFTADPLIWDDAVHVTIYIEDDAEILTTTLAVDLTSWHRLEQLAAEPIVAVETAVES